MIVFYVDAKMISFFFLVILRFDEYFEIILLFM